MRTFRLFEEYLHDAGNYFSDFKNIATSRFRDGGRNVIKASLPALAIYLAVISACGGNAPTPTPTPTPTNAPSYSPYKSRSAIQKPKEPAKTFEFRGDNFGNSEDALDVLFGTPFKINIYIPSGFAAENPVLVQYARKGSRERRTFAYVPAGKQVVLDFSPEEPGCYDFYALSLKFEEFKELYPNIYQMLKQSAGSFVNFGKDGFVTQFDIGEKLDISLNVDRDEVSGYEPIIISGDTGTSSYSVLDISKNLVHTDRIRIDKPTFEMRWSHKGAGIYNFSLIAGSSKCGEIQTATKPIKVTVK